jgi:hypothetical protein
MGDFPSKENQFKKGQSGNPDGRPVGAKGVRATLNKYVYQTITDNNPLSKEEEELPVLDHICLKLIKQGNEGNVRAIEVIMDRVDGKSVQGIEMEVEQVSRYVIEDTRHNNEDS